jgi:membrane-associated phospholipid phosphatase
MARMPYRTFALYNILGGLVWAIWNTLLGYIAGANWKHALDLASRAGLLVLAFVILGVGAAVAIRAARRRTDRLRALADWLSDRIAATRPVVWAGRRFPRQLAWLHRRLDPATPSGLALTSVLAVAVLCGWMFGGLTQDVLARDRITQLDQRVQTYLLAHRLPWLTAVMETSTWLGSTVVLVPVLAVASVFLLRTRQDLRTTFHLWVALGGAVILYEGFKSGVGRARPPAAQMIVHAGGYAYPSGHVTQATVVWGLLAFLLAAGQPRGAARTRTLILVTAATVILLVGASRIYLGVHWLTDVLGGYALGTTGLALLLAHRLRHGQTGPVQNPVVAEEEIDIADP